MCCFLGLSWAECKKQCPEGVVPACHNSVDTVTISGPMETTNKFLEELKAKGVFVRDVKSSNVAYHSYYMKAIAPQLKAALEKVVMIFYSFYLFGVLISLNLKIYNDMPSTFNSLAVNIIYF